ncbi:hypothetical protein P2L35_14320, partial [Enterococcus faecium]|uniref:hypothetical protein n=1 Tax=Enterococcus faecium TaxID=1352 RepID=UPI0025AF5A87
YSTQMYLLTIEQVTRLTGHISIDQVVDAEVTVVGALETVALRISSIVLVADQHTSLLLPSSVTKSDTTIIY